MLRHPKRWVAAVGLLCGACGGGNNDSSEPEDGNVLRSSVERAAATVSEASAAASDGSAFTWSFYSQIADPSENIAFSPYSISTAVAMLSAGAAGETLDQIRSAMKYSESGSAFHQSHNALSQALESRNHAATEDDEAQVLRSSNDLWMAPTLDAGTDFLDTLARYYGAGVQLEDFAADPEGARAAINAKVSDDTGGLISELIPSNTFNELTAFVLTNALYFAARWRNEFYPDATSPETFTLADGSESTVQMMHALDSFNYASVDGAQLVGLPYFSYELEMAVILPEAGSFETFAQNVDSTWVENAIDQMVSQWVDLSIPKMQVHSVVPLKDELVEAGMIQAFDPSQANFDPIDPQIYISDAFHQATILVDEEGTEAAAATAIIGATSSGPPPDTPEVVLDRPFIFLIRDTETRAVLFAGHFAKP